MKSNNILIIFYILVISVALNSCKKDLSEKINENNSEQNDNGVYVSGFRALNGIASYTSMAMYWKDGVPYSIGDSNNKSYASDIFVKNGVIYVVGSQNGKATIWKNGLAIYLSSVESIAKAVFVTNNKEYVVGEMRNITTNKMNAVLWVNGEVTILGNPIYQSSAESLCINGADIYIVGKENTTSQKAMLWKNNVPIILNQNGWASAQSVCVFNNNIYVVGYNNNHPTVPYSFLALWTNGVQSNITDGTAMAEANSVFVDSSGIYITGYEDNQYGHNISAIWINGVKTNIAPPNTVISANDLFKKGNDLFVAMGGGQPKLWKNGNFTALPIGSNTPHNNSHATSVFVK